MQATDCIQKNNLITQTRQKYKHRSQVHRTIESLMLEGTSGGHWSNLILTAKSKYKIRPGWLVFDPVRY